MRTLSAILTSETHQLHGDHPLVFLAQLQPGTGPLQSITNTIEPIVFHGTTFDSRPFALRAVGEGSMDDPVRIEAVVGNASRYVNSLKEQFWRGVIYPEWIVTIWHIDQTQPDEVPFAANSGKLRVQQIRMDDVGALLEMAPESATTTRNVRMRRITVSGGFPTARVSP